MAQLNSVVTDGYDRACFAEQRAQSRGLAEAIERAGRLLPHAEALVEDLFAVLYKLNVVLHPTSELSPAVLVQRRLLDAVLSAPELDALRARTALRPAPAAAGAWMITERILRAIGREYRLDPQTLVGLAETAHDEEELARHVREREHLDTLAEETFDPTSKARLREKLDADIQSARARLRSAAKTFGDLASRLSSEIEDGVGFTVGELPDKFDALDDQLAALGGGAVNLEGATGRSVEARMELGERLLESKKLQRIARLLGAFREVASEARRRRVSRAPQTLHSIETGSNLERLLPSELLGLDRQRRAVHRDFLRRYAEGTLLTYDLRAPTARGPMVICLDGSGSMQGSKELWSKAVALTLMEIARQQRRRCLGIIFSAQAPLFEVDLLGRTSRYGARAPLRGREILRFAEHFPSGGTDFETPLRRAVEAVSGEFSRGDIVFITDGQADDSDHLLDDLKIARKKHRFRIRALVVDVGAHARSALDRFADDVREVSDLATDALSDVFASM